MQTEMVLEKLRVLHSDPQGAGRERTTGPGLGHRTLESNTSGTLLPIRSHLLLQ